MLLKTRREYTLCFLLFAPLGMAGYSAGTVNSTKPPEKELTTTTGTATKAGAKHDAVKGGQSSPNSAAGGLSTAERLTRLLGDGRKAYREGDLRGARSYFRQALDVDGGNAEAKRLLSEVDSKRAGMDLSAESGVGALSGVEGIRPDPARNSVKPIAGSEVAKATVPEAATGSIAPEKVQAIVAEADQSKSNQQHLKAEASQVAMNASESLGGTHSQSRFSKLVGQAVSFAAEPAPVSPPPVQPEAAAAPKGAEKAAVTVPGKPVESAAEPKKESAEAKPKESSSSAPAAKSTSETKKPAEAAAPKPKLVADVSAKVVPDLKESVSPKSTSKPAAALVETNAAAAAKSAARTKEAEQASEAAAGAKAGIKLYNAGKYEEAISKFDQVLKVEAGNPDAAEYRARAEKKVLAAKEKDKDAAQATGKAVSAITDAAASADKLAKNLTPPLLDLDKVKQAAQEIVKAESKEVAQAAPSASSGQKPQTLKPLSEALGDDKSKKPAAEPSSTEKPADPIVEADKLVRDAQKDLREGRKDAALNSAKKAAELDPKNSEASSLVTQLTVAKPAEPTPDASSPAMSLPPLPGTVESKDSAPAATAKSEKTDKSESNGTAKTETVALPSDSKAPSGVDSLLTEGKNQYSSGNLREATLSFKAVLEKDPDNSVAKEYVKKIESEKADGGAVAAASDKGEGVSVSSVKKAQDAESAFQQGLIAYQAGRLDVAVQHWNYALTINASHPGAIQYLELTRAEYDAWVQQHQYNAIELQKEVSATEKLDSAVTYDTAGQKSLIEFLSAMSLITDIQFYVTEGVDSELRLAAKFDGQSLHDALDIVLLPIGLKWSRTGDVITVTTDLRHKFFNLTPDQVARLKGLIESKTLQRYLYGPEGVPPMRNVELTLDPRENLLVATDTQENLSKIEAFLKDMQVQGPEQLIYKNWKIRPEEGQRIKSLVDAIVKIQSDAPWDLERKVVVDDDDLIVKDTPENIAKIEQLLLDKNFLKKLETQKLDVVTFNLTPREIINENVEQARDLAESVVTVVKTILYSQSTESQAAAEGRRYWWDRNTLQLTVTDNPENLRIVSDYIRSLPQLGNQKLKSEIIFLKHQTASDMSSLLSQVLGLEADIGGGGEASGLSVVKTLRVEGELTFRDLRIRITKVNDNDVNDDNDDSVEMVIRTGTTSEDRTIEEFRSEFIDEYELNVIEVRPSSTAGEGSARIEVRYAPQGQAGIAPGLEPGLPGTAEQQALLGAGGVAPVEETGLTIDPVENMNALLIRYDDPGDLDQVRSWLEELDTPVLQVSIETKLVEVNETRVKQFMPEFNFLNFGNNLVSGGMDTPSFTGNSLVSKDGLGGFFEESAWPAANNIGNADLLNPVSTLNVLTGGNTPVNFSLRMLESEGLLNLVNGPKVTVENGEAATFQIELNDGSQLQSGVAQTGAQSLTNVLQAVNMEVTPQITKIGEIRLEISLELNDDGHRLGNLSENAVDLSGPAVYTEDEPAFIYQRRTGALFENRRKELETIARVQNHGTIVLGGWTQEHTNLNDGGVPVLRHLPYIGKLLFAQTNDRIERTNLLIFLTCHLVDP